MKSFGLCIAALFAIVMLSGCAKTLAELKTDGNAVVDNGVSFATQALQTGGALLKKLIGAGFAVYDIGKSVVDDSQDNVGTVYNTVTGASETPDVPAAPVQ